MKQLSWPEHNLRNSFPLDILENDFTASEKPTFLDTLSILSVFQLFMEVQVDIFIEMFSRCKTAVVNLA